MSIRVMLADDHTLVRQGIRQLLESDKGFIVTDEAGDRVESVKGLSEGEILDIRFRDGRVKTRIVTITSTPFH